MTFDLLIISLAVSPVLCQYLLDLHGDIGAKRVTPGSVLVIILIHQ